MASAPPGDHPPSAAPEEPSPEALGLGDEAPTGPDPQRWLKAALGLGAAVVLGLAATYVAQWAQAGGAVAHVDGQAIPKAQHESLVRQLRATYTHQTQLPPGAALPAGQEIQMGKEAMAKLVEAALIAQEAKLRGVTVSPEQVASKEAEVVSGFQGQEKFEAALKEAGVSLPELRERMKEGLLAEALAVAVAGPSAQVSEAEAKAYYEGHRPEFQTQEQRRASHILVSSLEEAQAVVAKLKAGGDFLALARSLSIDTGSGSQGGDLGFFGKGRMVAPFEAAVFSMKQGERSAPVKSRFGYHVIWLTGIRPAGLLAFEQVAPVVQRRLTLQRRQAAFAAWLEGRKKAARLDFASRELDPRVPPEQGVAPGQHPGEDTRGHAPHLDAPASQP